GPRSGGRPPAGPALQVERWRKRPGAAGIPDGGVVDGVEVSRPVEGGGGHVGEGTAVAAEEGDGGRVEGGGVGDGADFRNSQHVGHHVHRDVAPIEFEGGDVLNLGGGRAVDGRRGEVAGGVIPEIGEVAGVAMGGGGADVRCVVALHQLHVG